MKKRDRQQTDTVEDNTTSCVAVIGRYNINFLWAH